jgi:hypothetical protein
MNASICTYIGIVHCSEIRGVEARKIRFPRDKRVAFVATLPALKDIELTTMFPYAFAHIRSRAASELLGRGRPWIIPAAASSIWSAMPDV